MVSRDICSREREREREREVYKAKEAREAEINGINKERALGRNTQSSNNCFSLMLLTGYILSCDLLEFAYKSMAVNSTNLLIMNLNRGSLCECSQVLSLKCNRPDTVRCTSTEILWSSGLSSDYGTSGPVLRAKTSEEKFSIQENLVIKLKKLFEKIKPYIRILK